MAQKLSIKALVIASAIFWGAMVFGLFKKKDPICGMKEEKGKGISKHGYWFCSQNCLNEFEKQMKEQEKHSSHHCH